MHLPSTYQNLFELVGRFGSDRKSNIYNMVELCQDSWTFLIDNDSQIYSQALAL